MCSFFVRSGSVWLSDGYLGVGRYSDYWSHTANLNTAYAYYLGFGSADTNSSNFWSRYAGRSLRCLQE